MCLLTYFFRNYWITLTFDSLDLLLKIFLSLHNDLKLRFSTSTRPLNLRERSTYFYFGAPYLLWLMYCVHKQKWKCK